jgi:hypothetical protein
MSDHVTLLELSGTYKRVSTRIYRILEDGYDFGVVEQIIGTLDRDALIVDAAFCVLIFGQVENRLNELAVRRVGKDRKRQAAIRNSRFEKRLALALPVSSDTPLRSEIARWYERRNDAAHGERLVDGYDVEAVLNRAFELDSLVSSEMGRTGA